MASPPPGDPAYDQEVVTSAKRQNVATPTGDVVERDVAVSETVDNVEARRSTAYWISGVVYFLFGLIEIVIALRVLLKLLAANPNAGFTQFIYNLSAPFVAPFEGIVGTPSASNGSVFEFSSILAIIVYLLLSWIIVKLLQLLIDRPVTGVSASRAVGRRTDV
jgi:YggT family protein